MATHEEAEIRGLKELQAALRKMDPELKKALNARLKELTGEIGAKAKQSLPFGPPSGGHLGTSIRPFVKSGAFGIRMGNNGKFAYAPWIEHGGTRRKQGGTRPFIKNGRYLITAYEKARPTIIPMMVDAIEEAKKSAGLD